MFKSLVLALSLLSSFNVFTLAQADSTAVGIEAIEAHFSNAGIVPSLLSSFEPTALLTVNFDGVGDISPGQPLTQDQVQPEPTVTVTPANSSVDLSSSSFTLLMVDAGPVGTDETQGQTRHWLVNGVTVSGTAPNETVSNSSATAITEYAGPAPPSGSGPHRYVILLYTQPSSFTPPANLSTPNVGVSVFSLSDYVQSTGLGPLVAGTYMTVEVGTATVTPSATSPVVTSTLPVPSGSSSSSGTKSSGSSASTSSPKSNAAPSLMKYANVYTLAIVPAALALAQL